MQPTPAQAAYPKRRLLLLHGLSTLLLPVWLLHAVVRALRDGGKTYLRERLGLRSSETLTGGLHIWVHCASVGEVNTVMPLLKQLHQMRDDIRYTVTTFTPTGKQVFEHAGLDNSRHCYLPIDHAWTVNRFIKKLKPDYGLIVETEIWPSLYRGCYKHKLPISLINARISPKTLRLTTGIASRTLMPLLADALSGVSSIIARSAKDEAAIRDILAISGNSHATPSLQTAGNLKNDISLSADPQQTMDSVNPLSRRFCLLASTHEDEEYRLCKIWLARQRDELLVVVPRHPERGDKLASILGGLCERATVQRSHLSINKLQTTFEVASATRIYIADTLGELQRFYRYADVAFIGGSLVPVGGHNVLEATRHDCAIVTGPHTHNFDVEIAGLQQANALVVADNEEEVVSALVNLLDDKSTRDRMIEAARKAGQDYNVIPLYAELILDDVDTR